MAESIGFRTQLHGFHKDDVLEYIRSIEDDHARESARLQNESAEMRDAYEKALNAANAELARQFEELQSLRDPSVPAAGDRSSEVDALRAQVASLSAQLEKAKTYKVKPAQDSAEIAMLKTELLKAKAENTHYRELVQNVGKFIVEVRAMGQRYLDDAGDRCEARLTAISQTVNTLITELTAASGELADAKQNLQTNAATASIQFDRLAQDIERSASFIPPTADIPADFF